MIFIGFAIVTKMGGDDEFVADHPFLFILQHNDVALFIGRYLNKLN